MDIILPWKLILSKPAQRLEAAAENCFGKTRRNKMLKDIEKHWKITNTSKILWKYLKEYFCFFLIKVANWENLKLCRKINFNASVCQLICLPFKNNFLSKENFEIRGKVYCSSFAAVATGTFNWPIIDLSWDKDELLEWTWYFSIRVARHCIVRNRHLPGEITF